MESGSPSLVVAIIGSDQLRCGVPEQLIERLQKRGLRAHLLRSCREPAICECDILLIPCPEKDLDPLTRQIEQLWTQRWASWYASVLAPRNGNPQQRRGRHHVK